MPGPRKTTGQSPGGKGKCSEGGSTERGSGRPLWEPSLFLPLRTPSPEVGHQENRLPLAR